MTTDDLREQLAALCHDQWSGWMRHLYRKFGATYQDGSLLPHEWVNRWRRQMNTTYDKLSESEKESDRKEADRILEIVENQFVALRVTITALTQEKAEWKLKYECSEGVLSMTVHRLEGIVEGAPTGRHNFLQRIDELRELEAHVTALTARLAQVTAHLTKAIRYVRHTLSCAKNTESRDARCTCGIADIETAIAIELPDIYEALNAQKTTKKEGASQPLRADSKKSPA